MTVVRDVTLKVLCHARQLIATPNGWTQGAFSRDSKGNADEGNGCTCYCAWGAIRAARLALGRQMHDWHDTAMTDLKVHGTHGVSVPDWNDDPKRTQADVIAAFDKTIAAVKGQISAELGT